MPVLDYCQRLDDEERLEMGDPARIEPRVKIPRRTIYFASGETMEEYSTDEEEEEEEEERARKDVSTVDTVGRVRQVSRKEV